MSRMRVHTQECASHSARTRNEVHISGHTHTHTYTHIYTYTHTYIHTYTHTYTYTSTIYSHTLAHFPRAYTPAQPHTRTPITRAVT